MDALKNSRLARLAALAIPLVAVVAVLTLAWGQVAQQAAQAQDSEARMALNVSGDGTSCDDASEPTECTVPLGGDFTLTVDAVEPPAAGYILIATFIDYGSNLTYTPREEPVDEIVWPDLAEDVALRGETGPGLVNHGGLTAIVPPLPVSEYVGTIVELDMTCTDEFSENTVKLIPAGDPVAGTNGTMYTEPDGTTQIVPPAVSLVINCGEAPTAVPEATATPPAEGLPPTGTFGGAEGDGLLGVWTVIGVLLAIAGAGAAAFAWKNLARGRRAS